MTLEIQVLAWDKHTNIAGSNQLMVVLNYLVSLQLSVNVFSGNEDGQPKSHGSQRSAGSQKDRIPIHIAE